MRKCWLMAALLAALVGGCMFDSHMQDRTHLITYRAGLEGASVAHGSLVLPTEHVKIEVRSDLGTWALNQVVKVLP